MIIREQIEKKLKTAFNPVFFDVVDESCRHISSGLRRHFKILLVSDCFIGESFLNRHRMIYDLLTEELSNAVYAIALYTYTMKEWKKSQNMIFSTPSCRGSRTIIA